MVEAWLYNETEEDGRAPHKFTPNQPVSLLELKDLGILHWTYDPETELGEIDKLAEKYEYKSRDQIEISKEKLPNYEEKLKSFFTEHLHDDEEIRYILAGSGYFDIRNKNDQWVRIHTKKGDMIILPIGCYHRFILDQGNYIHAMRLFKEDPKWTPINRSAETDKHPARLEYLRMFFTEEDEEEEPTASKRLKLDKDTDQKEVAAVASTTKE